MYCVCLIIDIDIDILLLLLSSVLSLLTLAIARSVLLLTQHTRDVRALVAWNAYLGLVWVIYMLQRKGIHPVCTVEHASILFYLKDRGTLRVSKTLINILDNEKMPNKRLFVRVGVA